jgi:hypothetical protein
MIRIFGTRQLRRVAGSSKASISPFNGFSGLNTLECLAEELPAELQLAVLRQLLVRRMCIDSLLRGKEPMATRFADEIRAAMG